MKKEQNSRRKAGKVVKAKHIVKAVLREKRRCRLSDEDYVLQHNYRESYNQKEKDVIMNCLFCTEGSFDVPYDGYYYYELKPNTRFYKLVPRMHKYHEAREWLNDCDELHKKHQEAYAREICKRGVTREIEAAFIWDEYFDSRGGPWHRSYENVLRRLHKYGHKFSPEARNQMRWHCWDLYMELYPEECHET